MPMSTTETKTTARTRTWPRSRLDGVTLDEERAGRVTSTSWFGVAAPPRLALLVVAPGIDRRPARLAAWTRDFRRFAGRRVEEQLSLRRGVPNEGVEGGCDACCWECCAGCWAPPAPRRPGRAPGRERTSRS